MSQEAAHKRKWQTFEVVFGLPFLAAIALQMVKPLAFPETILTPALFPAGVILIIVGLTLIVRARREFSRHGQPTDPGHPTIRLVTTGVFSISRNPLYLGGLCTLIGIALALDLPWVLVFLLPSLVAARYILVLPEERYLATTFGGEYAIYRGSVNRWLGRTQRRRKQ